MAADGSAAPRITRYQTPVPQISSKEYAAEPNRFARSLKRLRKAATVAAYCLIHNNNAKHFPANPLNPESFNFDSVLRRTTSEKYLIDSWKDLDIVFEESYVCYGLASGAKSSQAVFPGSQLS